MANTTWVSLGNSKGNIESLSSEVIKSLLPIPNTATNSRLMRAHWEERLLEDGWVKGLAVGTSRLSIGYARDRIGMCIQMGNTSRVYADLLKLETIFRLGAIDQAVLVVPSDEYSATLGTNYANFNRAEQDIQAFSPTITVPILLISLDNRRGTK
jgi:hypothetical protein